jgi:hypothetical protein
MPENTVSVTRPGKFGNPYKIGQWSVWLGKTCETVDDCLLSFRKKVMASAAFQRIIKRELAGKDVACWCKPGAPCHADILLEIANSTTGKPINQ